MLLIETKEGNIRKSNIVQYIPVNKYSKEIPKKTFTHFYNSKKIDDAVFAFLSITDRLLSETEYKNGAIYKYGAITQNNTHIGNRSEDDCIEWYWQTYENGVLVSEQYIFTTCGGQVVEEGGGGGGSGGGGGGWPGGDEEAVVSRTLTWTVATNPASEEGIGEIKATETIKGRRRPSTPVGGYFTQIVHNGSICNFCSSNQPNNVWWETGNIAIAFGQSAYSSVTGNLSYDGELYYGISNSQIWSFQQIFP